MKLEEIKAQIHELLGKLEAAIEFSKTLGLQGRQLELLEDQQWYLERLLEHIEVLETSTSLVTLESELKKTKVTLQGLKETLRLYDQPNLDLIAQVEEAQKAVNKNLKKVKKGRATLQLLPFVIGGGLLTAVAVARRKR